MPIVIDETAPLLLVHDTMHQGKPLTIFFDLAGNLVEAIHDKQIISVIEHHQMLTDILAKAVLPLLSKLNIPIAAPPQVENTDPKIAKPAATHTSTINPAEALRREVAAAEQERVKQEVVDTIFNTAQAAAQRATGRPTSTSSATDTNTSFQPVEDPPMVVQHSYAVCDRCPVACKVDISHTATGKFLGVTGNACDRGIGFAQNFLLEKFSEPLR